MLDINAKLIQWSETYSQNSDSCQDIDTGQELTLSSADAGGGHYIILETTRWAIDAENIDAFAQMLKDFIKKAPADQSLSPSDDAMDGHHLRATETLSSLTSLSPLQGLQT
jgi:hypothetical protein